MMVKEQDFWKWAYSDFMSNALRGVLSEYIIATALNITDKPRIEWDAYDLKTTDGIKIEVKSSAYIQSWPQKKHSVIRFDIGQKKAWYSETNTSLKEAERSADIYVFCIFSSTEKNLANPLDTSQWFFLVCSSDFLNRNFSYQKSVGLATLEQKGLERITYNQLVEAIEKCQNLAIFAPMKK